MDKVLDCLVGQTARASVIDRRPRTRSANHSARSLASDSESADGTDDARSPVDPRELWCRASFDPSPGSTSALR